MILLIPAAVAAIWVWWRIADSKQPFPTPNAAPAPEPHRPVPARAKTAAGPALRVHLCTRQCGRDVARPGEACYPVCSSPVHDAERILREADGAA